MSESAKKDIDHLNSFLRGEISAVETHRQAIGPLTAESGSVQTQLNDCPVRDFITTRIVPEQTMTHSAMSSLERAG